MKGNLGFLWGGTRKGGSAREGHRSFRMRRDRFHCYHDVVVVRRRRVVVVRF